MSRCQRPAEKNTLKKSTQKSLHNQKFKFRMHEKSVRLKINITKKRKSKENKLHELNKKRIVKQFTSKCTI